VTFQQSHWYLKDLQYEYLDDGFKLIATTDVPCHLFARMTTTPPRKHSKATNRRGLNVAWDIRFCFVVYEDNEQEEPGDTLIHTWLKSAWPVCETRWFYFIGNIAGLGSVSESPIFKFHFPAPPPEPPPPLTRIFFAQSNSRDVLSNSIVWPTCRNGNALTISWWYRNPWFWLIAGAWLTASFTIYRSFLFFDTSPLPATAKILSSELLPFAASAQRTSSALHPYIQVTKGYQSDPVIVGDWHAQTDEALVLGQIDLDTIINGRYNSIPLNQNGLDHINLTGITRYCIKQQMDTENSRPPLGTNELYYYSPLKGGDYRPYLEVDYYPA